MELTVLLNCWVFDSAQFGTLEAARNPFDLHTGPLDNI